MVHEAYTIFDCVFVSDVVGLLTSLHYDFIVDAGQNLATIAMFELTDERFDFYQCRLVLFRIFQVFLLKLLSFMFDLFSGELLSVCCMGDS